jgi:glyoxylase-like metal-dependent hydrolase (beta-lactamase superfamily II)
VNARAALDYPFPDAPAPGRTRELAPGIRWIRMPVPFPPEHINLWLLDDGEGWAIVDAGLGLDETKAAWEAILAGELGGRRVTRVIVTHFHPDHIGLAAWLAERCGVEVWMTPIEWITARGVHAPNAPADIESKLDLYRRNGVPAAELEQYRGPTNEFYRRTVPAVPPRFRRIAGGSPLAVGAQSWLPIIGRGHAPEHACLWNAAQHVLICGDILLPRISPNVSVWPSEPLADPLADYLASLGGFAQVPAHTLVLPSHGLPYRGVHMRIAELHRHHAERLDQLAASLAERPLSAVECFPLLFRRAIGRHNIGLALGEALAHLHRLEAEGRARRVRGDDGVFRFAAG